MRARARALQQPGRRTDRHRRQRRRGRPLLVLVGDPRGGIHGNRLHPRPRTRGDPLPRAVLHSGHSAGPRIKKDFDDEGRVTSRHEYLVTILELHEEAKQAGLWLPHMPVEWGGMGLGHVELAMVQAEAGKTRLGPWILNCMAPDEGNMHTLLHWATEEQKDNYLRRLCEGTAMSCCAMTEPEVAGSDPTLIQTRAEKDGDEWIINGHKSFHLEHTSGPVRHFGGSDRAGCPAGVTLAPTRRSSSISPPRAGTTSVRSRPCTGRPATPRSSSRTCGSTTRRSWAGGATGTDSGSTGWARPGWPTACGGSPRRRQRST